MHTAIAAGRAGGHQQRAWSRAACRAARCTRASSARLPPCAQRSQKQAGVHGRPRAGQQRATARVTCATPAAAR
eukprot:371754-Lingulodinium_polyedra.AAC.1